MAKRVSLEHVLTEFADVTLKRELEKYKEAGKKAARKIREGIVNRWFGEYNSTSVNESTKYVAYTKIFDNLRVQILIHSYVDLDYYREKFPKTKAEEWRNEYGGNWDAEYYVLVHLQMVQGIIGLPKESVARSSTMLSPWYNDNFVQRDRGLREVIQDPVNWVDWDMLVRKYKK